MRTVAMAWDLWGCGLWVGEKRGVLWVGRDGRVWEEGGKGSKGGSIDVVVWGH